MTRLFHALDGFDGIYVAQSARLSTVAIKMLDGAVCLYSPIAGTSHAVQNEFGDIAALLAPNHYHNKGIHEHIERFPNAKLLCSPTAAPRLKKVTGLRFSPLDHLRAILPKDTTILEPDGLKTGEVWLQVNQRAEVAWIVTDAFSAPRKAAGMFASAPTLLPTFPKYGIKSTRAFRAWVADSVAVQPPTVMIPCHGSPVRCAELGAALLTLFDDLI